jgi:hypothetical protein
VYEVVASEPELGCMTQIHSIRLLRVTETEGTFISWQTEFSNGNTFLIVRRTTPLTCSSFLLRSILRCHAANC